MSEISSELQRCTDALAEALSSTMSAMDGDHMAASRPAGHFVVDGLTLRGLSEQMRAWEVASKMEDCCDSWESPKAAAAQEVFDAASRAFGDVCPADFDRDDDAEVPVRLTMRAQESVLDALEQWESFAPAKTRSMRV